MPRAAAGDESDGGPDGAGWFGVVALPVRLAGGLADARGRAEAVEALARVLDDPRPVNEKVPGAAAALAERLAARGLALEEETLRALPDPVAEPLRGLGAGAAAPEPVVPAPARPARPASEVSLAERRAGAEVSALLEQVAALRVALEAGNEDGIARHRKAIERTLRESATPAVVEGREDVPVAEALDEVRALLRALG